jgi:predicted transcriptional regulator
MKENGFLAPERITLRYVLESKSAKLPQLITVEASSTIRTALDLITGKNISQLPVFDNKKCIGSVSEGNLLTILLKDSSKFDAQVRTVMEPPFPEVHMNEEISRAVDYFAKKEPAVLVKDDAGLIGIITRFDVLGYLSR